jgi:STE24 endopeptidase
MSETIATCIYLHQTVRERWKTPAAVVAAVVVAEAVALLLRPRTGLVDPAPVKAASYFSPAELDRARDFRGPQLALYGGILLVQAGVLIALVRRPPRLRPAAAGALLAVALSAAPLPLSAIARQRAVDVGLVTQSWGGWAGDVAKSLGIAAVEGAVFGAVAILLVRRLGRRWWIVGSIVVVFVGAAYTYAGPVVLDPIFNKFTELPAGPTRSDVLELADRAGLKVGKVLVVDASRRTTAANAYVTGLGSTKRVVLYDNLIKDFSRDETRLVVAHELGHVHYNDVPRGLLYLAIIAPFALFAVSRLAGRDPSVPALVGALLVVAIPVTTVSNGLSRAVEQRADAYALKTTGDTKAFIGFQRRIAIKNVSDPDPPGWQTLLLGTHPTTVERIGLAITAARRADDDLRTRGRMPRGANSPRSQGGS